MSTLIVGASGYLGSEVVRQARAAGHAVVGTATTATGGLVPVDITDRKSVHALVTAVLPRLVVNCTGHIDDWRVTADGAANVVAEAAAIGARIVHVSTDALHAGRPTPYTEADAPTPVSLYGAAKAAAETATAAISPAAVIVRTSLIAGTDASKHVTFALDLINGRKRGVLFSDEIRCPVHVADLAAAILELGDSRFSGIINVAGPEAISRAGFGRLVARSHGLDEAAVPVGLSTEAGLGPRPLDVRLDTSLAQSILRTRLRPVSDFV
ncbi:dTDP-4-dehydrorhamnose reductase [Paractinoplanes deccanensis]|uniref:dTDP-4-dehydrorhamnose reductase n=1 Tax=Paractinoplanes deccanensis TaxID=113561 RepID=A0ABQ3YKY4_9ACTN|nr:sugar nucleotide-binding protein [Actinoplanes deccanensis]GID80651.1 dTDP-4-dehydrorhamnose reductase [Actinoplanes deccanensis]